jgi:hypothetical protein
LLIEIKGSKFRRVLVSNSLIKKETSKRSLDNISDRNRDYYLKPLQWAGIFTTYKSYSTNMKLNGFSVTISEGKEAADGYVYMKHGAQYTILLQNESNRRCDAEVYLDDQQVGIWRINCNSKVRIERPVHDNGRFTFYQVGTSEALKAGISENSNTGLIRVLFKPEQIYLRSAPLASRALMAGGTGLSGHSDQEFTTVAALDYAQEDFVTIHLRLVSLVDEPRPLFHSTPIPPAVIDQVEIKSERKAMTWSVLNVVILDGKPYALFGADAATNPYTGDTDINSVLPLLCIKKMGLPKPEGLHSSTMTNGGAIRGSWSGGKVIVVPDVQGKSLTSQVIADLQCRLQGLKVLGEDGFRMAEFHDGDREAGIAGWDFWADASAIKMLKISDQRYWVSINDQPANPWG